MSAGAPFAAMLLLGLLKQRAFALEVIASLNIAECENEIFLGQINKTFCVEHVFHGTSLFPSSTKGEVRLLIIPCALKTLEFYADRPIVARHAYDPAVRRQNLLDN
jgi:hypothetical protein